MGICTECNNQTGMCNFCGDDFQEGDTMFCFREMHHFCNEDCLMLWLKEHIQLKEATCKKEEIEEEL